MKLPPNIIKLKIKFYNLLDYFFYRNEYRRHLLTQLKRDNANITDWMKKDWDLRAKKDPLFFTRSKKKQTLNDFWQSGKIDRGAIIGINLPRHQKIFQDKDPKKMKVLEIGCGNGRILIPMSEIFGQVMGVDVSPEYCKLANERIKKIPNCKVYENNGKDLSMFPDSYFDFCYSFIVFQHIPHKKIITSYIKEVSRVLKSGCLFRFQVNGNPNIDPVKLRICELINSENKTSKDYINTWLGVSFSSNEISDIVNRYKFEIIEEDGINSEFYWITFKSIK